MDSAIPRDEALRRFRDGVPPVAQLEGGAPSKDSLLASYVRALWARDTAALGRHAITRAEFAWLYYPTTPQGLPPYDVEPGLLWFLLSSRSDQGARRALSVYGGQRLRVVDFDCGEKGNAEGENTIWGPCMVRWRTDGGDTVTKRLLGQIIERDGRFKVLSFSNRL